MNLFNRKKNTEVAPIDTCPVVVSVPDIKDYLVKEYERANALMDKNNRLEEELEVAKEIHLKYDATLVTLDEYSKRLKNAEDKIERERARADAISEERNWFRDQVNSYQIRFNNAALTKEQIKDEIIEEFKSMLIAEIKTIRGSLSKQRVCEIITQVQCGEVGKDCFDYE